KLAAQKARTTTTETAEFSARSINSYKLFIGRPPSMTHNALLSRRVSGRLQLLVRRLPSYGALLALFNALTHKLIEPLIAFFFLTRIQALNTRQQRARY